MTGAILGGPSGHCQIARGSRRWRLTIGMHTLKRWSHDGTVLDRNPSQTQWLALVEETQLRIFSQTYGPMPLSGRGDPAGQTLPEAHQCCYPLAPGFRRGQSHPSSTSRRRVPG